MVPLYTIEESVQNSLRPFCDQCRCTGQSLLLEEIDLTCYRTLLSLPLEQDSLKLKGNTLGGDGDRNRLNHKDLFTYIEAASEKERMVHVAVEESVAFYEVWAFSIVSLERLDCASVVTLLSLSFELLPELL